MRCTDCGVPIGGRHLREKRELEIKEKLVVFVTYCLSTMIVITGVDILNQGIG